jgi:acetolactate synthase-1/3 small subunit
VKHLISALVENKPGVLVRVAGLFSRRGFNIESLSVGPTENEDVSRMTIVLDVKEEHSIEQINKQLHKLINVMKIQELDNANALQRELILVKIKADAKARPEIIEIVDIFRAKIIDVAKSSLTVEVTGTNEKLQAFEDLLKPYGILELVRTGKIALGRG